MQFLQKIIASLVICKMKSVQAHEIGGLALQKNLLEKIVLTMLTTGTNVDFVDLKWHFIKSSFTVKIRLG